MHTKYILKGKSALNRDKKKKHFVIPKICVLLHSLFSKSKNAQMAELVDALVSNTNGCKSLSVRSRLWVLFCNLKTHILFTS